MVYMLKILRTFVKIGEMKITKPKLLGLYRTDVTTEDMTSLPTHGIWQIISIHDLDKEHSYYKMRCVYPTHLERKHMDTIKVWREFVINLMEEVKISATSTPKYKTD